MEERTLIRRAIGGDKEAFAAVYMQYRNALYRYAYFRLGDQTDAEDAVSACVVAAFEGISGLRSEAAFRAWIFRILYRSCGNLLAARSAEIHNVGEEALEAVPDEGGERLTPELTEAFGVLDDEDREIVLLSVIAGYNSREIASLMSLKPTTVRSRLSRSLAKMRLFLTTAD